MAGLVYIAAHPLDDRAHAAHLADATALVDKAIVLSALSRQRQFLVRNFRGAEFDNRARALRRRPVVRRCTRSAKRNQNSSNRTIHDKRSAAIVRNLIQHEGHARMQSPQKPNIGADSSPVTILQLLQPIGRHCHAQVEYRRYGRILRDGFRDRRRSCAS